MTEATTSSTISSDSPTHAPNPFHLAHAITNIKSLIPITIDIKNPNYQKWSHFFAIAVGRFALHDVLHGAERPPFISSDDWNRADYLLQSWIYSTISDDLSSMILSKTANAHDLWLALSSLFTDNKDYRAVQLEEKFKSFKKGSLSIHDYCQSIKLTANSLADVGHSLTDKQLVLQTLHGLPRSYSTVVNLISFQNPLPSFLQTRSLLQMEETRLAEPETQPTILYTHPQPSPYSSPAPGCGGGGNYRGGRGRGGRGRGRGGPRFPQSHMQSFGYQQYNQSPRRPPPPINQFSAPPSPAHYQAPSPAPAHPQSYAHPPQQTYTMFGTIPAPLAPSPSSSLPWMQSTVTPSGFSASQSDLGAQFDALSLRCPPDTNWYMDTGASSHMASDAGILSSVFNNCSNSPAYAIVGNGSAILITSVGHTTLPHTLFSTSLILSLPLKLSKISSLFVNSLGIITAPSNLTLLVSL